MAIGYWRHCAAVFAPRGTVLGGVLGWGNGAEGFGQGRRRVEGFQEGEWKRGWNRGAAEWLAQVGWDV